MRSLTTVNIEFDISLPSLLGLTIEGSVKHAYYVVYVMDQQKPYKFVVRLPLQLRDQIGEAAQHYRRSMNSEIVARLEHSFSGSPFHDVSARLTPTIPEGLQSLFAQDSPPTLALEEELVLRAFRRLPLEKRQALLELIKLP